MKTIIEMQGSGLVAMLKDDKLEGVLESLSAEVSLLKEALIL